LYYLDLNLKSVAYSSSVSLFDQHRQFGHPFLQTLKFLLSKLNHVTPLDCESCELGKYHHMPYPESLIESIKGLTCLF